MVDRQEEGLRNVLVIHDADTHDFGAYNCSVVNEYGVARKQIRLNEETTFQCSSKPSNPWQSSPRSLTTYPQVEILHIRTSPSQKVLPPLNASLNP
ncbi:hypothetical protein E2C01_061266 [Portunus trituberculatus]|uniref:Immunoglobulin I-set domain-containing protein n=1 Tax=Portunus trituberculatus TaxID=210409 RepID=A0A5B7H3E5_PORTR|nr:hypothetical protein [Portunus trituberculatus]